jgi:hypothetical protein
MLLRDLVVRVGDALVAAFGDEAPRWSVVDVGWNPTSPAPSEELADLDSATTRGDQPADVCPPEIRGTGAALTVTFADPRRRAEVGVHVPVSEEPVRALVELD